MIKRKIKGFTTMKKIFFLFVLSTSLSALEFPGANFEDSQRIAFQNSILCKVNDQTISMMDIKKKMDVLFHQHYPQLSASSQARFQFYETSWRHLLSEMINQQLILADAENKEIKLSEGEVREELENRFGPNVTLTLDRIGLSQEEALKMIKEEMTVQRMMWWFVHAKALQKVTPQEIRQQYRAYLKQNPSYKNLKYQILSLRGENAIALAKEIHDKLSLSKASPETLAEELKEIAPSLKISSLYEAKDSELSETYKSILSKIAPGEYSRPMFQNGKEIVARVFYLQEAEDHPAPEFKELSSKLQNDLTQKAVAEESESYLKRLRENYGFDEKHIQESLPEDFHPFSIH